jgi:hypothetical protein
MSLENCGANRSFSVTSTDAAARLGPMWLAMPFTVWLSRFAPGQLPPANAFWSLTMYELPASLLTANPINRYLINSAMLPTLRRDPDGGLTLIVQHESPGEDKESNWLPAPKGPFVAFLRMYWPKPAALDGTWKQPPLTAVK